MSLINPYNFVPLGSGPNRDAGYPGRHRFGENRYSGKLRCRLTVKSPLITIDHQNKQTYKLPNKEEIPCYNFLKNHKGIPVLQGTSLKGMVRSVYEAVTDSCPALAATSGNSSKAGQKIPYNYQNLGMHGIEHCADIKSLCPACRLFGVIKGEEIHCQGRVHFSDAALKAGELETGRRFLKELSNPKPHHCATYGKNGKMGNPIAGRKFYYHQGEDPNFHIEEKYSQKRCVAIDEFAPIGSTFEFDLSVENLNAQELANLILSLELEKGCGHKSGLGKAIGMGSCRISILRNESDLSTAHERYSVFETEPMRISSIKIEKALPASLREVLRLDKYKDGEIGYPDFKGYNGKYKNVRIGRKGYFLVDGAVDSSASEDPVEEIQKDSSPGLKPSGHSSALEVLKDEEFMRGKVLVRLIHNNTNKGDWVCKRLTLDQEDAVCEEPDWKVKKKAITDSVKKEDLVIGTRNESNPVLVDEPRKVKLR